MDASAVIILLARCVRECLPAVRLALLVTVLLAGTPLFAQNAELSGLISDPPGLAVSNARVAVQSVDNDATRNVISNQRGEYSVVALPPGSYNVTVEATGFKTIHQNAILLEVDQRARLDFALTVGSTTETITVEGYASAQHLGRIGEHGYRSSVRGESSVERAQL